MSSTQSERVPLEPAQADNISFDDESLTWKHAGVSHQAKYHEIVLVIGPLAAQDHHKDYLIILLKEDPEDENLPFRLSAIKTTEIPDKLQPYLINEVPEHLRHGSTNEVDIIVSTNSGTGLALKVWQDVLQPLWGVVKSHFGEQSLPQSKGQKPVPSEPGYRAIVTQSSESVREFARELWAPNSAAKSRTIILLTGDGGVVDLLNGPHIDEPRPTAPLIALLPLGTGNALFHSMHKPLYTTPGPTPLVLALRTLFHGKAADLPVFQASFSPGSHIVTFTDKAKGPSAATDSSNLIKEETSISHLNGAIVASYGFHASIVYESDTPEHRVHGAKRFGIVAQDLLAKSHPYAARVEVRRRGSSAFEAIPRDTHAYALTTLVSNLERTFTISPATTPLERQLRLVHFGPVGGERTMEVMVEAYNEGKHVGLRWDDGEAVGYEEVEEVRVVVLEEEERWRKVCIDGTIVEVPKGGQMSVKLLEKGPLRVLADASVLRG
ncbi:hypothetical protein G7046_g3544 [Stylonectria norvegica]|nr:hypothetical protein G7046_g3544 [Stylonectria norvegica]